MAIKTILTITITTPIAIWLTSTLAILITKYRTPQLKTTINKYEILTAPLTLALIIAFWNLNRKIQLN